MDERLETLLPNLSRHEVRERVDERWAFVDGCFPVPRGDWLRCAACGSDELQLSRYHFHCRREGAYRCDVKLKCTVCSHFQVHAPVVSERQYRRGMGDRIERGRSRQWTYRDVLEALGAD